MGSRRSAPLGAMLLLFAVAFTACEGETPSEPADPKGSFTFTLEGLPEGVDGAVTVEGPGGFQTLVTESTTLEGLTPGGYDITVGTVSGAQSSYTSFPAVFYRVVSANQTVSLTVTYSASDADNNLWVEGMYVAQVVQEFGGSVPLVAGRESLLRVFVRGDKTETVSPVVRVSFYDGDDFVESVDIPAPGLSVASEIDESDLESSWNLMLTPAQVAPGLRILAELDPENVILETDETDNRFPASGLPFVPDVRELTPLGVRFVPIHFSSNGLTGAVDAQMAADFMEPVDRMMPLASSQVDLRTTYTTSQPGLMPMDENGSWGAVLSELWTVRASEDPGTRHWYGVVDCDYGAGIAGIAYVGDFTGLGRQLDSPIFLEILPHELGHNLGRQHSACGTQGQHQDYPHANGRIGAWGYDLDADLMYDPTTPDVMGYCSNVWISDYTYENAFDHRDQYAKAKAPLSPESCLMVWGRIDADGAVTLEPAFRIDASPRWPQPGPHRLEIRDAQGDVAYAASFAGREVADLPQGSQTHFAFLLPLDADPTEILVRSPGGEAVRTSQPGKQMPRPEGSAAGNGLRVTWDASAHPVAMVRDADTGQILSFARGGSVTVPGARAVEVQVSDGVRAASTQIAIDR